MFKLERRGGFPNWHQRAEPSSSSEGGVAAWLSPSVTCNPLLAGGVAALRWEGLRRASSRFGVPARREGAETAKPRGHGSLRAARFLGRVAAPKKR
jgi:hypothetical protein